ncbi:MAG: hypothetical protein CMK64_11250 [Pseudoalteromonas sp.]|nr:hypothetical protein [Pseudoalteromonas sp.]|tara:strand:+ start:1353 stop:1679 length:327 start_codon:yes stop_codon:yes gene_type:complete
MTPNKATFSAGAISTVLLAGLTVLEKHGKVDTFTAEISTIFIPLLVACLVWGVSRILHRVEPYTDAQIKQRARTKNSIKEIKAELKEVSSDEMKKVLEAQLAKHYNNL